MEYWIQHMAVGIIIAIAAALALRALLKVMNSHNYDPTPCLGCPIATQCRQANKNSSKKCDKNVAHSRK